jgi:hypothetical protein
MSVLACLSASAQNVQKMSDAEQLGMMAGLAMACGADKKLEDFDLIASRLLANQSPTEQEEIRQVKVYTQAKWEALQREKRDHTVSCQEVLDSFQKLPLFNAIVYADGSVKLPDGIWSKPLRPVKKR